MNVCGVVTSFDGVHVYARSTMSMSYSLMCLVLGDLVKEGCVAKENGWSLLWRWHVTRAPTDLDKRTYPFIKLCILHLSALKATTYPTSTTLVWCTWNTDSHRANTHHIAPLVSCSVPSTVTGLRSFIVADKESKDTIVWSESTLASFQNELANQSPLRSLIILSIVDRSRWIYYTLWSWCYTIVRWPNTTFWLLQRQTSSSPVDSDTLWNGTFEYKTIVLTDSKPCA